MIGHFCHVTLQDWSRLYTAVLQARRRLATAPLFIFLCDSKTRPRLFSIVSLADARSPLLYSFFLKTGRGTDLELDLENSSSRNGLHCEQSDSYFGHYLFSFVLLPFKRQLKTHLSVPALDSAGCSCECRVLSSGAVVTVQRVRRRLQISDSTRLDSSVNKDLYVAGVAV